MAKQVFKGYDEVEEFFKNLGIEYRFSCYHENNAEGCHFLGNYMTAIKNDWVRANKIYKDNCDNNKYPKSCVLYGDNRVFGHGIEKDLNIGVNYYEKGCDYDDPHGCFNAGQLFIGNDPNYNQHIKSDIKKSINYLEKGCGLSKVDKAFAGECCFTASSLYIFGTNGCEKNMEKAFELSLKGCEYGNINACNNLSLMYSKGLGTEKNIELADKFRAKVLDYHEQLKSNRGIEFQRT